MNLIIHDKSIQLEAEEYLDFHEGRIGYPFILDVSICGIKDKERAEYLKKKFIAVFPFPSYRLEIPQIVDRKDSFELLFSVGDFTPIVKSL